MPFPHQTGPILQKAEPVCVVCGSDLPNGDPAAPCLACGHGVWFDWSRTPDRLVASLGGIGVVTEQNIMRTLGRLESALSDGHAGEIVLDFGPVSHLTSTAVAHVVVLKRRTEAVGGPLKLVVRREELLDIFRITRLDSIIGIEVAVEKKAPARRG